ncbi:putative nepenthesin [Medicago truncatula]|uniref:Eukaryotic aspartyl protease family protein n=2 Tax=Medicago truncatula TaxID=3880 RepID=G7IGN4_MEDTR|nr:eukaryotic aspartyl protease family protein [Medicago truncatula]RHN74231.1 putative nepenthesin [Medicago truncatula]
MTYHRKIHLLAILLLVFIFPSIEAHNGRFTVKLIPRNSSQVLFNRITAQTPVSVHHYDYLMELSIGTPPVKTYAQVDTGSDLIWLQCIPCTNCYKQLNPMFDPQSSSTYSNIAYGSESCSKLYSTSCSPDQNNCNYTYSYEDDSITEGVLAQETLTLTSTTGKPVALKGVIFGCGHNNNGVFNDKEMGIIGLGRGPLSLVSQIGSSFGGKMFSQCLVPFHTNPSITSPMSFGKGSEVLGNGVVSTPLVSKNTHQAFYFVTLLGISVEDINLPFNDGSSLEPITKGNMVIDSGTPTTLLPEDFYHRLVEEVRNKVALDPIPIDPTLGYQLCYRTPTNLKGTTLTAHFEGADVLLTPTQIFIPVQDGIFCFAFTSTFSNEYGIYGNHAQSNYLIGFDLEKQLVSFKATDCTNLQDAPSINGVLPNVLSAPMYLLLLPLLLIILQN